MVSSVAASKRGTFGRQQWLNAEAPAELQDAFNPTCDIAR
jgi:hypothetical protein